jgi:hypothetical protein
MRIDDDPIVYLALSDPESYKTVLRVVVTINDLNSEVSRLAPQRDEPAAHIKLVASPMPQGTDKAALVRHIRRDLERTATKYRGKMTAERPMLNRAERQKRALRMRAEGKSLRVIARELGVHHQTVVNDLGVYSTPDNPFISDS